MEAHPRMPRQHSDSATVDSSIRCVPTNVSQDERDHHHGELDVQDVDFASMHYWAPMAFQPSHTLPQSSPTSLVFHYDGLHQDSWVGGSQYVQDGLIYFHESYPVAFVEPTFSDYWARNAASYTQSGKNNSLFSHDLPHDYETAATNNLLTDRALNASAAIDGNYPSPSCAQILADKSKYRKVRGARNQYHCTFRNPETMEQCPRIFQSRQGVVNHFNSEHLKIKIPCPTCNGRYPMHTLSKHQKRHDEENGLVNQRKKVAMEEMKLASNAQHNARVRDGANFNVL